MSAIRKIGSIDSSCIFLEDTDYTKKMRFELDLITSGTTRVVSFPDDNITLIGKDQTVSLTNKTIDSDLNTISNIDDSNIKNGAAIDASKIANGSVSNTEFQYLNGTTSNIQDQIDAISNPWITIGNDIYRDTGNVSIGSDVIDNSRLKITGSGGSNPWLTLEGSSSNTDSGAIMYYLSGITNAPALKLRDLDDPSRIEFEQVGSGTINSPQYATWFGMASGNSTDMRLEGGNLGIGINPSEALHVSGNIAVTGTVDGRDIASDGSTLDSIVSADGSINTHSDVVISSPQSGQILSFDGNNWINIVNSGGNISKFDAFLRGNPSVGNNWTDMPLNNERIKDSAFSHASSSPEITFNTSGNYLVIGRCTTNNSSNSRSQSACRFALNTGSGFVQIDGTLGYMYNRSSAAGETTATVALILSVSSNDIIKMQVIRISGSNTIDMVPDACSITIISL